MPPRRTIHAIITTNGITARRSIRQAIISGHTTRRHNLRDCCRPPVGSFTSFRRMQRGPWLMSGPSLRLMDRGVKSLRCGFLGLLYEEILAKLVAADETFHTAVSAEKFLYLAVLIDLLCRADGLRRQHLQCAGVRNAISLKA